MGDAWTWRVEYGDGTTLSEGELGTFGAVDLERCVAVELIYRRGIIRRKRVRVEVDAGHGQRAVFFRRRQVVVSLNGLPAHREGTLACVGWEDADGHSAYRWFDDRGREQASG